MTHHRRWILVALALAAFLVVLKVIRPPPAPQRTGDAPLRTGGAPQPVELVPGQEGAIEVILGRGDGLPGACRYDGREILPTHITARYSCPGSPSLHVIELHLEARERGFEVHVGRFGVETSAGFPVALRDTLLTRLETRSPHLLWQLHGEHGAPRNWRPPPSIAPTNPGWTSRDTARLFDHDPTLGFILAFGFIVAFTARQLRRDTWHVAAALALIVAFGLAVRLCLAVAAPMNAHPFTRVIPQAINLFRGPVMSWLSARHHLTVYFTDFQGWFNLALSTLMPLVFFTHARLLLDDVRKALAAAALMALLPMHIRFAQSDVIFVLSLVNSSLTFVTIYGALSDPSRVWRLACNVALPLLSLATYLARPENYAFAVLDLGALALYLRADVPRRRVAFAAVAIAGAAGYAVVTDLLTSYQQNVSEGLSLRTLVQAWEIATDRQYNTLINPWMTPPPLPLLAAIGFVLMWRGAERRKAVFLAGWLASFFLVNSYIRAPSVAMQARYHLNLVSPLLLLAAASLPAVRRLPAPAGGALALWLALSPMLHRGFIRDVDYTEMHEHSFLRRYRHHLTERCTVVEFGPAFDPPNPQYSLGLRAPRMSMVLRDGVTSEVSASQLGAFPAGGDAYALEEFALPPSVVAHPPECFYYYESAACWTHGPAPGVRAPACEAMHQRFRLTLLGESRHAFRALDHIIAARRSPAPNGARTLRFLVSDRRSVRLALYRVSAL